MLFDIAEPVGEPADVLTPELRARIKRLELVTRRAMAGAMSGAYRSSFRGSGVEFEEVRPYQPGDEVRAIDWNVTARTGEAHIKTYREERELRVHLAVDCSRSMDFGTAEATKREKAAELAALLTAAAAQNNDPVSLDLFDAELDEHFPPRSGSDHVLRVLRAVMGHLPVVDAGAGTGVPPDAGLLDTLTGLGRTLRRRALLVVVSDFAFGADSSWATELELLSRRHDVVCARVTDPLERKLPDLGWLRFGDAESGAVLDLDSSSARVRAAWDERAGEARERFRAGARRARADVLELDTARPSVDALVALFQRRAVRSGASA